MWTEHLLFGACCGGWHNVGFGPPKSTHHPHKIDDQHRECKTGGGAYFAFFLGSENSHTTPPKIPPDEEGLFVGMVRGWRSPMAAQTHQQSEFVLSQVVNTESLCSKQNAVWRAGLQ